MPVSLQIVKLYIREKLGTSDEALPGLSPAVKSKYKQLQVTGLEAEIYFMQNFQFIDLFKTVFWKMPGFSVTDTIFKSKSILGFR